MVVGRKKVQVGKREKSRVSIRPKGGVCQVPGTGSTVFTAFSTAVGAIGPGSGLRLRALSGTFKPARLTYYKPLV